MNAWSAAVMMPRNIIGSGTMNGTMLKRIRITSLFAEDVAEQPERERQHARQVADHLDGNMTRRDPDRGPGRRGEVLQMYPSSPCALMPWKW